MEIVHVGWCFDKVKNHDKVWGVILLERPADSYSWQPSKYLTFWGRRGAKLQTKLVECNAWKMDDAFNKKCRDGYQKINRAKLNEVYPEFQDDLEKTAVWATLGL